VQSARFDLEHVRSHGFRDVDVLAALREAAEPDIQAWARSVGADGSTILADYRRAVGRE
jgi:ribosomal protein L34